jgi:hypothetical protein
MQWAEAAREIDVLPRRHRHVTKDEEAGVEPSPLYTLELAPR